MFALWLPESSAMSYFSWFGALSSVMWSYVWIGVLGSALTMKPTALLFVVSFKQFGHWCSLVCLPAFARQGLSSPRLVLGRCSMECRQRLHWRACSSAEWLPTATCPSVCKSGVGYATTDLPICRQKSAFGLLAPVTFPFLFFSLLLLHHTARLHCIQLSIMQ